MPIYSIQGPNGQTYKIEGPAGATDAQLIATLQQDLASRPAPKKGIGAAAAKGLESLISSGRTAVGAAFGSPEEAAKEGLQRGRDIGERYAEPTSLARVKQAYEDQGLWAATKEAVGQVPGAIAEQAPQLATMAGTARLGATAGSLFGPVGTVVGGLAGAVAPSLVQQFGGNIERQAAEQQQAGQPVEIDRGSAVAAAVPQAALDVAGSFIPFGGKLISKVTGIPTGALFGKSAAQVEKLANEKLLATLAKGTAVGAAAEIPTEIAQQMLERAQAGLSLSSPEAMKEYGETAYSVGLLAPLGAAGRVSQRAGARGEVAAKQQEEQAQAATEAKVKADEAAAAEAQRKAAPEYLLQLDQQHAAALAAFNQAKNAVGKKPGKEADDDAKDAYKERLTAAKEAEAAYKTIREEHKPARPAIEKAKEEARVADMTPQDYMLESMGLSEAPATEAAPEYRTMDDLQAPVQRTEAVPEDALQQQLEKHLEGLQYFNQLDVTNAVSHIASDPALAQQVLATNAPIPGLSAKEGATVRSALKLQLKELGKEMGAGREEAAATTEKVEGEKAALQRIGETPTPVSTTGTLTGITSELEKQAEGKAPGVAVEQGLQKQNYTTKADEFAEVHDNALFDLNNIVEDIAKGRFLNSSKEDQRKLASSTREGLAKQAEEKKQAYIDAVLQEAANRRAAQNMQPITTDVATKAAVQMNTALDLMVKRQTPAEDIKRQLEVVKAQLAVTAPQLQRVETPVRVQGAGAEAAKTAEARGETAKTLEGELRRRRDYVENLVDKALQTRTVSKELSDAFAAAQDTLATADKTVLNAVEDAADRVLRGQEEGAAVKDIDAALRTQAKVKQEIGGAQKEMFGTEDLGAIRASAANFRKFLNSATVAKLRESIKQVATVVETPTKGAPAGQLRRMEQAKTIKRQLADKEANLLQSLRDLTKQMRSQRVEATYGPLIQRFEKDAADFEARAATLREALPETGRADPDLDSLFDAVGDIEAKISETRATITSLREKSQEAAADLGDTALLAAADERIVKERAEVKALQDKLAKIDVRTYEQRQLAAEAAKRRAELAASEQLLTDLHAKEQAKANAPKERAFGVKVSREALTSKITAVEKRIEEENDILESLKEQRALATKGKASGLTKRINTLTQKNIPLLESILSRLEQQRGTTITPIGSESAGAAVKKGLGWSSTKPVKPAIAEVAEPTEEKTPKAERVSREENVADIKSIAGVMARQGSETDIAPKAKRQAVLRTGETNKQPSEVTKATKAANKKMERQFREALAAEKEGPVYRAAQTAGRGMDKAAVEALVAEHTKDWKRGPKIVVTEAPREAGNATGGLSRDGKTMFIYYDNVRDEADTKATVFHEGLGHFGLRDMFKQKLDGVLNSIYKTNADMRKAADAWLKDNPDSYTEANEDRTARAVEEVLAIHSEAGIKDASLWSRIKAVIRAFGRRMGMTDLAYTNEELDAIVAQAHQRVMQSGELGGTLISETPVVYRARTKYASDDALSKLSGNIISQPKSFAEKAGKHYATELEMQTTDMRAGLRKAMEAGAKALGDPKLFTQAMYSVTKAGQKMSVVQAVLSNGPAKVFTDEKGLKGLESNNEGGAKPIFEAMSEIPDRYGDNAAKVGITSTYLIARRAMNKGLSKLDIGAMGVTEQQLADAMQVVENDPALKAALEKTRKLYNQYNKGLIQGLVETGTIPKSQAAAFLKDEDYVPFYRVRDNGMAELVFGGEKTITIGDIRHQPYLAELKGGETKILPLNESLQRNTLLLTDKMLTNMAQRNVAYALQAYGSPQNLMKIQRGKGPAGPDIVRFTQEPKEGDKNDTGERWLRVETNDTMLDGIPAEMIVKSLDGAHLTIPAFLKWGAAASDLLRSGVTRTPLYLMRQLFRDPMAASFTAGLDYSPIKAVFKANKAFLDLSRGQSETGAKLIERGLIQSGIFTGDPEDMAKFSLQLASGKSQGAIDKFFALMDRAAMNADAATRTLVYDNAIKNGLSEVEADLMVMESMNFHKRGLSPTVQYASRMIPFFNAQIQGLNVLYKAARGQMPFNEQLKIKKKFINNAVMLMGMGMVYAMAMEDDEYYKNAKPKDRYSNFFVPLPGVEEPLKLPIPYEAGWFFSMAVATVDAMKNTVDSEQQFTALKDMIVGAVPGGSSMGVPQIVKPWAEVWTNKNFFSGNPLESTRLRNLDPEARYNANTTELAKALSKQAEGILSPIQIEHLVRGYMGQLPIAAMAAANGLFTSDQSVEAPAGRASELPVVGSAFQRKQGGDEAEVAYRIAGEAVRAKATYNEYANSGKKEEAKEYLAKHKPEIAAASAAGTYTQLMGDLRKRETIIRGLNIGAEEKRNRLDKIEDIRQKQSERFVQVLKKIEADVERRTPQ